MKLIQSFDITEGMSMNSLKPSINSEPDSSLDSCTMKEVEDCLLSEEIHSSNNGGKDMCFQGYKIEHSGNAPKKMFEQVNLNTNSTNSEVTVKKDTWNSGSLYDKSGKENMVDSEVGFDILSDDELHLKISSSEENSIDYEMDDQSSSNKLQISEDACPSAAKEPHSENEEPHSENEEPHSETEEPHSETEEPHSETEDPHSETEDNASVAPNNSEISEDIIGDDDLIIEENEEVTLQCNDDPETKNTSKSDSENKYSTEDSVLLPSRSKSPLPSENKNDSNTVDRMINDVKSTPTSPETLNSKEASENSCSELETNNEGTLMGSDNILLQKSFPKESLNESTVSNPLDNDTDSDTMTRCNDFNLSRGKKSETHFKSLNSSTSDNIPKKVILLSDDTTGSNNKEIDETNCGIQEVEENKNNKHIDQEIGESDEIVDNASNLDDVEAEDSLKEEDEERLLMECSPSSGSLEIDPATKEDGNSEDKFLEILEYQPMNDEGEELREVHSDCDKPQVKIPPIKLLEEANTEEPSTSYKVCMTKISEKKPLPIIHKELKEEHTLADSDTVSVNSLKSELKDITERKESTNAINDEEHENITRKLTKLGSSENEENCVEKNTSVSREEEDVQLITKIPCATSESLSENSEDKVGRKRSSNCEEVNNSKRTRVELPGGEVVDECDVLICEQGSGSDLKKLDTKEKCDTRVKRSPDSISDIVEVKKKRILSDKSLTCESDNRSDNCDNSGVKNSEGISDSVCVLSESEGGKVNILPFLRNFDRAQLQKLTRNDLEELVLQKICEAITERSNCGELREQAQSLEQKLKTWQKKYLQLTKQIKDLNTVLKKYGSDLNKGHNAVPVKITRAVGLQVQMPGTINYCSLQEENSRRKGDKSLSSSSLTSPGKVNTTGPKSSNVQRVSDGNEIQSLSGSARQNSQSNLQPGGGGSKPRTPTSTSAVPTNSSKLGNKVPSSPVSNKGKSSSDLQVIDLTDHDEKTKNNTNRLSAVSTTISTTSSSAPVPTSAIATSIVSNSVPNVGVGCRPIRVVQPLGSSSPLIAQNTTNAVTGPRITYLVPTTVQQRQLILSSAPQVRPSGIVSMAQRQAPLPTLVLKPGQGFPVSTVSAPGTNIIRTTTINSSLQLTTPRSQPRTGQVFPRFSSPSAVQSSALSVVQSSGLSVSSVSHPAPLPTMESAPSGPGNTNWKLPPPKPDLKINKTSNRNQQGIVLSWHMNLTDEYDEIASYQLFAYQEGSAPPSTQLWKKVGDVKALPLPMACTLTQFMEGHKYHFAVRAVDVHARYGSFSEPGNIVLTRN